MPHEVRDMVAGAKDYFFRPEDQEQSAHARDTYVALSSIVDVACASNDYKRHEASWNHLVHTPLLQLVFGPVPPRGSNTQQQSASNIQSSQKPPAVHFEVVMSAIVVGSAIPNIREPGSAILNIREPGSGIPDPAYSVSLNTSVKDSDTSTVDKNLDDPDNFHSRKESKKVDYVLAMCINDDDKLKKVIKAASYEPHLAYGHVNQTSITSLLYNPIAVSIETKIDGSRADPIIQLGLWVAAWHKRMGELRKRRFPPTPKAYRPPGTTETKPFVPKLVPVPLIEVKSHDWYISFAFDMVESIEIRGCTLLGSTDTIVKAYALITNLGLVKRWIETEFYQGITDWFTKDDSVLEAQDAKSRTAGGVDNQERVSVG
ncbi:hypothetical protein NUW58_g6125 [Xylaria curta]|uniref:Uncharacterized protein n=1 Tax=Xylaria curta TaxID=42375 RepID=A0ACC1P0W9_9PEZI|nr:hypothetical protein NUW58_g6125 [Xylaria curta]